MAGLNDSHDSLAHSRPELQILRQMIEEKEVSVRRKEKKLELLAKTEGGVAMREAQDRLKKAEAERQKAKEEAEEEIMKTLTQSGVPLIAKKDRLMEEIAAVERAHEEQEGRLRSLDDELKKEMRRHTQLKEDKKAFCVSIVSLLGDLEQIVDHCMKHAVDESVPTPYPALQNIQELTKEREDEISNNERHLREICQIILMKQKREEELQTESDEKIRQAVEQKDDDIRKMVEHCQRERQDVMDRVSRLRNENMEQAQALHWKSQRILRDMKDRKIDRTGKRGIREQIVIPTTRKGSHKVSDPPRIGGKKTTEDAVVAAKRDAADTERSKIKAIEADISKVQQEFQKNKRQLEYKISYEKGQAEQFERENQKLEQQAESLAATLQRLKSEVKRAHAHDPAITPRPAIARR
eukprot:TRINITY_DN350_c1_g1_i1.p1 TRINITY_DN350_c1_g1~~TRINITY_DN350_c1_g1_i1.p1  ORF type:complete len:410 (+),score=208.63 TRINITY_DN350_c1_g1_i1:46-1275(+)